MPREYLFLALLLAHLLYDFHWQGPFIAENKGKHDFLLAVHCMTWALLLWAVLAVTGYNSWWKLGVLYATHYFIDYWKSHKPQTPENFKLIYVDQALHLVTIILVSIF